MHGACVRVSGSRIPVVEGAVGPRSKREKEEKKKQRKKKKKKKKKKKETGNGERNGQTEQGEGAAAEQGPGSRMHQRPAKARQQAQQQKKHRKGGKMASRHCTTAPISAFLKISTFLLPTLSL